MLRHDQSSVSSKGLPAAVNEASDSPHHLTASWFIHNLTPAQEVNLWLQGYCGLLPTEKDQKKKTVYPSEWETAMFSLLFYHKMC